MAVPNLGMAIFILRKVIYVLGKAIFPSGCC